MLERHAAYCGIEIGGTKLQIVIGDGAGKISRRWRGLVEREKGGPGICRQIEQGLGDLLQVIQQAKEDALNPRLQIAGVVFTKVQKYKGHQEVIASLRGNFSRDAGISCFKTEIRQSAVFTHAANQRSVVVLSDPY